MRAVILDEIPWRIGRKLGRTIYRQVGAAPSDEDPFLGLMESPELAADVVACHNLRTR